MKVLLLSTSGPEPPRTIELGDLPVQIGRDPDIDVPVMERRISRRHCELLHLGGKVFIRDHSSKNGTFVNNKRVNESSLEPGDKVVFGRTEFVVQFDLDEAAVDSSPSAVVASRPVNMPASGSPTRPERPMELDETVVLGADGTELESLGRKRRPGHRSPPTEPLCPVEMPVSGSYVVKRPGPNAAQPPADTSRETFEDTVDADLGQVVAAWPALPASVHAGILAMVRAMLDEKSASVPPR